jgi:hypothetical protein
MKQLGVRGIVFDGVNDILTTPIAVDPTGGFSAVLVIRSPVADGYYILAADGAGAGRRLDFILSSTAGRCIVRVYNGVSNFIGKQYDGATFSNVLSVLAFTYTGGAVPAAIKFFRQGVEESSADLTGGTYTLPGAGDVLTIAGRSGGTANRVNGVYSDIAYFNRQLTADEVSQISSTLMNKHGIAGAPLGSDYHKAITTYSGLQGYWSGDSYTLTASKVSQLNDQSGNANHATQGTAANRPIITRADSRENVLRHSNDFTNSAWVKGRSAIAATGLPDPDGKNNASHLVDSTDNGTHRVYQLPEIKTLGSIRCSISLQAAEFSKARIAITNQVETARGLITVDLTSGAVEFPSGASNIEVVDQGAGWFRFSFSAVMNSADTNSALFIYINNGAGVSYIGTGSDGINIYKASLRSISALEFKPPTGAVSEHASPHAPFFNALTQQTVYPRIFVKLDLATTLQYWSGQGLRNFLGRTYLGNGFFQGIGQLSSMTFDDSGNLEIALAGEVTALRALIQTTSRFATGTVYLALYNSENQLIGYDTLFQGELDSAEISGGLGSTLSLTFSPLAETLGEFTTRVWSNGFHQSEFPDDIAFEYMPQLEEWSGYWGKPDNTLKKNQQGKNRTKVRERRNRRTERGRRRKNR